MNHVRLPRALTLSLLLSAASGCSSALVDQDSDGAGESNSATASSDSSSGSSDSDGSDGSSGTGETGGDSGDSGDPGPEDPTDTNGDIDPMTGQLTAGEWRDLDHWDYWLDLLQKEDWVQYESIWNFFTSERYAVVVEGSDGHIVDAQVSLLAGQDLVWEARTDIRGRAELFSGLFGLNTQGPLTIAVNGTPMVEDAAPAAADPIIVQLPDADAPAQVLDLLFMIDTTGSMSDELAYLQIELADVIDEIQTQLGQDFKLRLSVNFYRDEDEEYLVRTFPFTEDIETALADLAEQAAGGGGDYPEAVTAALDNAIEGHEWSESAVARLAFLVLDAPPHTTQDTIGTLNARVQQAAAKGIRVIPVASSGVDKTTEFFLRFVDIATGGTYVFLTSDSGIGGEHIEPTIGDYEVEHLSDLLVRLISQAVGTK